MSIWSKIYSKINWKDEPIEETPLSARNLNKMDSALDEIDKRVVEVNNRVETLVTAEQNGDEVTDIRVGYDGSIYPSAGASVRSQVSKLSESIDENYSELKGDLDDLFSMDNINLFDGVYKYPGYAIVSSAPNFRITEDSAFSFLIILKIKPNTTYTVVITNDIKDSDGYYRYKVATAKNKKFSTPLDLVLNKNTEFGTSSFVKVHTFTSESDDTLLVFQPSKENKPAFIQICEGTISDFTTDKYADFKAFPKENLSVYSKEESDTIFEKKYSRVPYITIRKKDNRSFELLIYNERKNDYLRHLFLKVNYVDTISGKSIVTEDAWVVAEIMDKEGNVLMQGNINFIHRIAGTENFVGTGHGCCVNQWCAFFADGKEIDPLSLTEDLNCDTFKFMVKAYNYLVDDSITTSGDHALPQLDSNGNPIITSVWTASAEYYGNNRIKHRNRLDIKRNGIQFAACYGAMCCGFYPYFNNVILNNREYSWNKISSSSSGTFTTEKVGDTTINIGNDGRVIADEVVLFGDKYSLKTRIIQRDSSRANISNIYPVMPPNSDNRLKMYLVPVVTTLSTENLRNGQSVETFNIGDSIYVDVEREIDF